MEGGAGQGSLVCLCVGFPLGLSVCSRSVKCSEWVSIAVADAALAIFDFKHLDIVHEMFQGSH